MSVFYVLLVASQVLGFAVLVLAGYWTGNTLGGFAWDGSSKEFNLHPLLMSIGLIYCYGNGILMYRVFRNTTKLVVKVLHMLLQSLALVFACIALKAVFHNHKVAGIPDLYSVHSWVGLTAFMLFCLQWVAGFLSFLYPKLPEDARAAYLPLHRYVGVATFAASVAAALIGINEKLFFVYAGGAYGSLPSGAYVGNFLGFVILLFGLVVGYLVTNPSYQRAPDNQSGEESGMANYRTMGIADGAGNANE